MTTTPPARAGMRSAANFYDQPLGGRDELGNVPPRRAAPPSQPHASQLVLDHAANGLQAPSRAARAVPGATSKFRFPAL